MEGIGFRLNRIYKKNTLTTSIIGAWCSIVVTVAPMMVVIGGVVVMQRLLDFSKLDYSTRELFSSTLLYVFIFALLTTSPFNSVLSRYVADILYEETYEDIMPCYYVGLLLNITFSMIFGVVFCVHEWLVGQVDLLYVFMGYSGYMALVLVFYSMLYLSICKDYGKISLLFFLGMLSAVLISYVLYHFLDWAADYSMFLGIVIGFCITASLEFGVIRSYFRENSGKYKRVISYFGRYWQLTATNFLYTLGLCIHNFVFWSTDMRIVVAKSFVSATSYDMATFLAMATNISASVIFISRVEMYFHERYRAYAEAIIGGRGAEIEITKKRMFRRLGEELLSLARVQFIITLVIFLLLITLLPKFGFGGTTLRIYPCLVPGYFILYLMYAEIIFLYYFNDLKGSMITGLAFCVSTGLGSMVSCHLSDIWYGMGLVFGSFVGWTVAYMRLQWMEKNLDDHIFCEGHLLKKKREKRPSSKVFDRYEDKGGETE